MPIHNLLEQSHNYSIKLGSFQNYNRDKIDDVDVINNASVRESFWCKTEIVGETPERLPKFRD